MIRYQRHRVKWRFLLLGLLLVITGELMGQQKPPDLVRGIALFHQNEPVAALNQLLVFVHSQSIPNANTAEANYYLGRLFAESGLHERAMEYFLKADGQIVDNRKFSMEVNDWIAHEYQTEDFNRADEARKRYRKALSMEKGDPEATMITYQKIAKSFEYPPAKSRDSVLHYNQLILQLARDRKDYPSQIVAINNQGITYARKGDYGRSITKLKKAIHLADSVNYINERGDMLLSLAVSLNNVGQQTNAITKLKEARKFMFAEKDILQEIRYYNLISDFYFRIEDVYQSELYNDSAMALAAKVRDYPSRIDAHLVTARIRHYYSDYRDENLHRERAEALKDSLSLENQKVKNVALLQISNLERAESDVILALERASKAEQERLLAVEKSKLLEQENLLAQERINTSEKEKQLAQEKSIRAERDNLLAQERVRISERDREIALQRGALAEQNRVKDSINNQLERETRQKELAENDRQLQKARADNAEQEREFEKSRLEKLVGFAILLSLLLLLLLGLLFFIRRANRTLKSRNEEIQENRKQIAFEKERSDKLLQNILPEKVAEELKSSGTAAPQHYEQVTVLFTDFKGFTSIAEKLSPQELVDQLDQFFRKFDEIAERHGLEKIKTIGDAYMCAGGIPESNQSHPQDTVAAALEIRDFMDAYRAEKEAKGETAWNIRIGVHTGPVVAGVVGKNKFAYDIWGDAVNTASRMESSGEAGKVNISEQTYRLIRNQYNCSFRGEIEAKNKGRIKMYFVEPLGEKVAAS